jgi:ribosomal protein S27AE
MTDLGFIRVGDTFQIGATLITVKDIFIDSGMGATVSVAYYNHRMERSGSTDADDFVAQLRRLGAVRYDESTRATVAPCPNCGGAMRQSKGGWTCGKCE